MTPRRRKRSRPSAARTTLGKRQLDALIDEAIVDAYSESEQRVGFLTMLQNDLACPFEIEIRGAPVIVEAVDSMMPRTSSRFAAETGTNS